ncbi:MAG: 16S rRNA (guanine(966)-N(2))-methyltransferase RsmD [Bacillota bacterium]
MRVIAGSAKGRILKAPAGLATRPTSDKVKGALFNILAPRLAGSYVLDLFAGTGALSIEALSRGAAGAVLVESSRNAQRVITSNLEICRLSSQAQLVGGEVAKIIPQLKPASLINIVFMDPPYHQGLVEQTLAILGTVTYLEPRVVVVAEHHRQEPIPERIGGFVRNRVVTHGDTSLSFFTREEIV